MSNKKGKLFLILGPSGVGKGTLISLLKKQYNQHFIFPVSATTRKPRPGERDGETYHFLSKEDFCQKIKNSEFLEWATVHQDNFYGTLKKPIFEALEAGKNVIRELDIQGFESVCKILSRDDFVSIFLLPPSLEVLTERIRQRSPLSSQELQKRLQSAKLELEKSKECHYTVQTEDGNIEKALQDLQDIMMQELQRDI